MMNGIRLLQACLLAALGICACNTATTLNTAEKGTVVNHSNFPSRYVTPRNVDVYLPPGYEQEGNTSYPVLYMHDGQNLYTPGNAFGGAEWGVDETLEKLIREKKARPAIVVGIWNTDRRFAEYLPEAPFNAFPDSLKAIFQKEYGAAPLSDAYLKFLVEELKPFIDQQYRTLTAAEDTYIAGSSMGGLISLYAICRYPNIFGRAACLSTHWPVSLQGKYPMMPQILIDYFGEHLPKPATHKIYFDYGTATLDSLYEPLQLTMDEKMKASGYIKGENWMTCKFPGAEHSEKSWAERLHVPFEFILKGEEMKE
ncbi:MAG: esterase family protein [Phaeodactylibacter sp.]|nr:esterase family protein [Phaeodactylibacter sp.]